MIPNEELWERMGQEQIITEILREGSRDGLAILFGSLQNIRDRHLAGTLKERGK